jgi:hypothetical protein
MLKTIHEPQHGCSLWVRVYYGGGSSFPHDYTYYIVLITHGDMETALQCNAV